jgi:hypothetical protein
MHSTRDAFGREADVPTYRETLPGGIAYQIIERDGVEAAFQRCVSRQPSPDETRVLAGLTPLQAARTLLNLDETITRE